jgi:uncharacterized protein (TIGR00730 family)
MKIAVYGGAQPKPGDEVYQQGVLLGQWIGENGHTVLTGGYMGIMEAVSQGAAEKGGHVIGVTCLELEQWRNTKANRWVREEWKLPTLRERLWTILSNSDLGIAMPGGAGTLAEISMLWNHQIIGLLPDSPIILIGEGWQNMFEVFYSHLGKYIADHDRHHLHFAPDVKQAIQIVEQYAKTISASTPIK